MSAPEQLVHHAGMQEHYYTPTERAGHLRRLAIALDEVEKTVRLLTDFASWAPAYATAALRVRALLANGFTQDDLTALAGNLPYPPELYPHPKWEPPLERSADGQWREPDWYRALGPKLDEMTTAARELRAIGYWTDSAK